MAATAQLTSTGHVEGFLNSVTPLRADADGRYAATPLRAIYAAPG